MEGDATVTAEITEFTTFGWYCAECADGAEGMEDEAVALNGANDHDRTNHARDRA
jgi:hypothetical protein